MKEKIYDLHVGFAQYTSGGKCDDYLYDGHTYLRFSGNKKEAINYLLDLRTQVENKHDEDLSWEGNNGMFYSGKAALDLIDFIIGNLDEYCALNC